MSSIGGRSGSFVAPGGLVELGYEQFTTPTNYTSTTATSPDTIKEVTVVCDGGPILVEACGIFGPTDALGQTNVALWRDGSELIRYWATINIDAKYGNPQMTYRDTPSAGSHTYSLRVWTSGAGSTNTFVNDPTVTTNSNGPGFIRVSKIVEQGTVLKPFWTPPLVTQLPTNPTVGDTVIYSADATNGVYWNLYYDGQGSYPWKYVGGSSLYSVSATNFSTASSSFVSDTNFTGITIPLAGDYDVAMVALANNTTTAFGWALWSPSGAGVSAADTYSCRSSMGVAAAYETIAKDHRHTLTTGTLGAAVRQAGGGTAQVATRTMTATPVRVAA